MQRAAPAVKILIWLKPNACFFAKPIVLLQPNTLPGFVVVVRPGPPTLKRLAFIDISLFGFKFRFFSLRFFVFSS